MCDRFLKCNEIWGSCGFKSYEMGHVVVGRVVLGILNECIAFFISIEQSKKNFQFLFCIWLNLLPFLEYYVTVTKKISYWNLICIRDVNACLCIKACMKTCRMLTV
jgi:hypothetical protein